MCYTLDPPLIIVLYYSSIKQVIFDISSVRTNQPHEMACILSSNTPIKAWA